jgi:molybdopterin-guanine dinucleotide biosynthesis protein
MVEGKDTWRLKNSGASKVVWINSTEQNTLDSFKTSLSLVANYQIILIEGNSILKYLNPDLSFFICDAEILDYTNVKPSRKLALSKTDIIINNLREGNVDCQENRQVEEFCARINSKAVFINLDLKQTEGTTSTLKRLLNRNNL